MLCYVTVSNGMVPPTCTGEFSRRRRRLEPCTPAAARVSHG